MLAEKVAGLKRAPTEKKIKEKAVEQTQIPDKQELKKPFGATPAGGEARQGRQDKPEVKTELGKKEGVFGNIGKKIFRRKVI